MEMLGRSESKCLHSHGIYWKYKGEWGNITHNKHESILNTQNKGNDVIHFIKMT
jgi:hypothetical protein